MGWRQALRRVGVLALACLVLGGWPSAAGAADTVAFTITDQRITESSGLARDTAANIYWTVNDSGDTGVAYGITPKGKVSGTLNFRAEPRDVEAVSEVNDRLYVGDIGDNGAERDMVTVYYFNSPRANGLMVTYKSWDFRYPDGAHDAETLLVNSAGRLFIVTKDTKGAIYAAPKEPKTSGVNKLTKVGDAPAGVTDGVFLPGDQQIALLRGIAVDVIDAKTYQTVASAAVPKQPQAESLAVSLDEKSLLVGSEGKKSKVYAMPVPGTETPSPSPTPSQTSDSDGQDVPDEEPDATTGQSRQGTFLALGLAAFAAVVAGLVVGFARKR